MNRRLLAVLVVLVALAARLPGLGRSIWYDEQFTLVFFTDSLQHALFVQHAANNHPLASVLAWAMRSVSEDPRVLRAPFALLGALGVLAVGWLSSVVNRERALTAAAGGALLALVHPAHVAYSQEIRGYAGLLLAAALTAGLALEGKRPRLLAVCVALGLFSHLTLGLLVLSLGALAVRERAWPTLRALAAGSGLALLLYAPMLLHLGRFAWTRAGGEPPWRALELLTVGDARLLHPAFAVPFVPLVIVGCIRAPRAGSVVLGFFLLAGAILAFRPLFYGRFLLASLPLLLALAVEGAHAVAQGRRALLVLLPLVAAFGVATARRAPLETEPIQPALESVRGEAVAFEGLGAELMKGAPREEATVVLHLFAGDDAQFRGLYANVKVTRLREGSTPAKR